MNIDPARLPDELIDYTIFHELVHTRIKNHGTQFWHHLDKLLRDAKKLDRKFNKYMMLLI
ncbi:MAG: M48 family metallopeptidase [Deltaproteobacteria bacterium]|nr:MAG: M48 family metallopeptidase [Deltaproteobacteria bacterium]